MAQQLNAVGDTQVANLFFQFPGVGEFAAPFGAGKPAFDVDAPVSKQSHRRDGRLLALVRRQVGEHQQQWPVGSKAQLFFCHSGIAGRETGGIDGVGDHTDRQTVSHGGGQRLADSRYQEAGTGDHRLGRFAKRPSPMRDRVLDLDMHDPPQAGRTDRATQQTMHERAGEVGDARIMRPHLAGQ